MDVYGEDGVRAAAVLVHVVRPDGAILQPLLSIFILGFYAVLNLRVVN